MDFQQLLDPDVQEFMRRNADADVRQLALKKTPHASWSYPMILEQIKVRQKAKIKSPELYDTNGFIFPNSNLFEQASSQPCAAYKASLASGNSFVDLTAGAGMDAFSFASRFKKSTLIERNLQDFQILEHNIKVLGLEQIVRVVHGEALEYVREMPPVDCVYIDPQRREEGRKGIYDLSFCSPDIIQLLPLLKDKTKTVVLKTSPVLDIQKAIETLGFVKEVYVVGWGGDCKEVLYLLDTQGHCDLASVRINAVDLDASGEAMKRFTFSLSDEANAQVQYSSPLSFIYEPSAAAMKSGGFKSVAAQHNLMKLHSSSHLYTCDRVIENFCGKIYPVLDIVNPHKNEVPIKSAELVLRNFPGHVDELRKKLKLEEGGQYRIFATTLLDGKKKLIICDKRHKN